MAAGSVAYTSHEGGQTMSIPSSWVVGESLFGQTTHTYDTDAEDCSITLHKTAPDVHDSLLDVSFDCETETAGTVMEIGGELHPLA